MSALGLTSPNGPSFQPSQSPDAPDLSVKDMFGQIMAAVQKSVRFSPLPPSHPNLQFSIKKSPNFAKNVSILDSQTALSSASFLSSRR
jgi:hypothetical protein